MKKYIILAASLMFIGGGCDWGNSAPASCPNCKCDSGCCSSGECNEDGCDCSCTKE